MKISILDHNHLNYYIHPQIYVKYIFLICLDIFVLKNHKTPYFLKKALLIPDQIFLKCFPYFYNILKLKIMQLKTDKISRLLNYCSTIHLTSLSCLTSKNPDLISKYSSLPAVSFDIGSRTTFIVPLVNTVINGSWLSNTVISPNCVLQFKSWAEP